MREINTLILLWLLYSLQGIPYGFQTKFLPVFLRSISVSLSLISLITFLLSLPWIFKPLWAPLVDKYGTKMSWISFNLLGMAFFYLVASSITLKNILHTLLILGGLNILSATHDIVVDSIIVDLLSIDDIGFGNIAQVVGYKCGSLIGGGVLGWLSSSISWQLLFFLLSLLYTFSIIVVVLPFFSNLATPQKTCSRNPRIPDNEQKNLHTDQQLNKVKTGKGREYIKEKISIKNENKIHTDKNLVLKRYYIIYRNILGSPGTKWTIIFILTYKLGEQGIILMFPMFLMDQGLVPSDIAMLTGIWCQSCSIFGSLLGGVMVTSKQWSGVCSILTQLTMSRLFVASMLIWFGSSVNSNWFLTVLFDCILHVISGTITTATFTLMVTCSQACPEKKSATHYSTLATFEVLGKLTMVALAGLIVEMIGYDAFFLVCICLLVIPVIILRIPSDYISYSSKVEVSL